MYKPKKNKNKQINNIRNKQNKKKDKMTSKQLII